MTNAFNLSQLANNTNSSGQVILTTGVAGALAVANGGTGVTTSTGSGNTVLSTSPTLVTPLLGTPTSGNLANCTGVAKAALPAGSVLQVVQGTYSTVTSTSSATLVTTNLTASITPRSTSSKILITAHGVVETGASGRQASFTIYRGAANLVASGFGQIYSSAGGNMQSVAAMSYLDSPATTSSTAYTIYFASTAGAGAVTIFSNAYTGTIILTEIQG